MADEWLAGLPARRSRRSGQPPRLPARGRAGDSRPLRASERAGQRAASRSSSSGVRRRPFSRPPRASPPRTSCGWRRRGCSWSCGAPSAEATTTKAPVVREHLRVSRPRDRARVHAADSAGQSCRDTSEMSLLVLFETRSRPSGPVPERRRHPPSAAERDVAWLRRELASSKALSAIHRRPAGCRRPGTAGRA